MKSFFTKILAKEFLKTKTKKSNWKILEFTNCRWAIKTEKFSGLFHPSTFYYASSWCLLICLNWPGVRCSLYLFSKHINKPEQTNVTFLAMIFVVCFYSIEFKELKSANLLNFFYNILFACYDVTWFSFEDLHAHCFILKKNLAKLKSGFFLHLAY